MKFTATWTMPLRTKHVAATRIIANSRPDFMGRNRAAICNSANSRPVFTCKEEG